MNLRGSRDAAGVLPAAATFTVHDDIKANWLLTLRPRLGFVVGNALIYATGGLAGASEKYAHNYVVRALTTAIEVDEVSATRWGWTVGAGIDYALSYGWSLRGEYLYTDLGNVTDRARVFDNLFGPLNTVFDHDIKLRFNTLRVGLNYKFGYAAAPAVYK
jgi:outer membrane immunogenic protein